MLFHTHPSQELKKKKKKSSVTPLNSQGWRGADETDIKPNISNTEVNVLQIYCDYALQIK